VVGRNTQFKTFIDQRKLNYYKTRAICCVDLFYHISSNTGLPLSKFCVLVRAVAVSYWADLSKFMSVQANENR